MENLNSFLEKIWNKIRLEKPGEIKDQIQELEKVLTEKLRTMNSSMSIEANYYYTVIGFINSKKILVDK